MTQTVSTDRRSLLAVLGFAAGAGVLGTREALAQMQMQISPDQYRISALADGQFAIETSRLAQQNSRNQELVNFTQAEINEQLSIAAQLGAVPGSVPPRPDQVAIIQQLASTPRGRSFDRAYVVGQIAGHRELLSLNRSYASNGFDPFGRQVAVTALPIIENHLQVLSYLRSTI